jgi:hypothetical protein
MNSFLGYLPDVKKKDQFVNAFLMEFEHSEGGAWSLDFMRLSIIARKF